MTTYMKFAIGVLEAEFEIDFSIGRSYAGGPTNYGWEPDEPGEIEIGSVNFLGLWDKNNNEVNLDSARGEKLAEFVQKKFTQRIDEYLYEVASSYDGDDYNG